MRVYFDNMLVTYLSDYEDRGSVRADLAPTVAALEAILACPEVEALLSEETLAEISNLNPSGAKRAGAEKVYQRLKDGKPVIRNARVTFNDPTVTFNSPDVFMNHDYDDGDLDTVRAFLASVGNDDDMDARYIANTMLPANAIDVFLTYDKKSIWNHRAQIKERFGVTVMTPVELAATLPT